MKTIIVSKDEFILSLVKDIEEMIDKEPKCSYQYIYNQAVSDVIDNIKTFMERNPEEDIEISLKDDN